MTLDGFASTQVLGEEADTLRHTLAELGVRIGRDQVKSRSAVSCCSACFFCVKLFEQHVQGLAQPGKRLVG